MVYYNLEGWLSQVERTWKDHWPGWKSGFHPTWKYLCQVGKESGNRDHKKNNKLKEENEKHCLNKKERNDMEMEESDDENDTHNAVNINQYESSSSGEITPSVRVTKNPLKVKDKVKYRLAGNETWIESEIVSR